MSLFRCATTSARAGESMVGSASTIGAFLLIEHAGPWGEFALTDSRLPAGVGEAIGRHCHAAGVRALLIRRHGRSDPDGVRLFAAYPRGPWIETTTVDDMRAVVEVDVAALCAGPFLGWTAHLDAMFLVCTHGRHDACCAERGRPLASALAAAHPEETWECSHIGGDRFAGNLLVLPEGLYYGRLDAEAGLAVAKAHQAGQIDLEHLRGRTSMGFAVQAAEWHLRHELGLTAVPPLPVAQRGGQGDLTEVVFAVDAANWRVRVRTGWAEPAQLTCKSVELRRAPVFELESIERVES